MIPKELKGLKQWTYSYSVKEPKRPKYTKYEPNGALDYDTAIAKTTKYVGIYVTSDDPYFLMDIDHIHDPENFELELPPKLQSFIYRNRTYCETSPSGKGIRLIFKFSSKKVKEGISGSTFFFFLKEDKREIQINIGPPWQTVTGNTLPQSTDTVTEVELSEVEKVFSISKKVVSITREEVGFEQLPEAKRIYAAIMSLPLDQNERIKRAYEKVTGHQYSHYDYWLKVLMALKDYCIRANNDILGIELAVKWSSTDPTDFDGEQSVIDKWKSLKGEGVTYLTLFKLSREIELIWPYPTAKGAPIRTQIANYKALLDYYSITLIRDASHSFRYYITGDEDVIDRWFLSQPLLKRYFDYVGPFTIDNIHLLFASFFQENGFLGVSLEQIRSAFRALLPQVNDEIDFFKLYIDTPFNELPEELKENEHNYKDSDLDTLWSCIQLQNSATEREMDLYKRIFTAWFTGLVRSLYYKGEFEGNSGMLLLTGPEQTYKTSFFRYLLPTFFRGDIVLTTHGFSSPAELRDLSKIAATSRIVVIDEVEQHFTDEVAEAGFKKLLDNLPQTVIDKYATVPTTIKPKAIYGATSNQDQFKLSMLGMRRLFRIPVLKIDTEKELSLCWHPILRELKRRIMKGGTPWILNDTELNTLTSLNSSIRSETNLDLIFNEVWEFDEKFDRLAKVSSFAAEDVRLLTLKQVINMLELETGAFGKYNIKAVKNTLGRKCAVYTNTVREELFLTKPKCVIFKGEARQGPLKKWVMPPLKG